MHGNRPIQFDQTPSDKFLDVIKSLSDAELKREIENPHKLLMGSHLHGRSTKLDVVYAPFDHVNPKADIVVVGITPGRQQMKDAILHAAMSLRAGASHREALEAAKVHASFSGTMRLNLVKLLNRTNVTDMAHKWFMPEMAALPNALYVPMGDMVAEVIERFARGLGIPIERILTGMPHAAGSNNGPISWFLGGRGEEHPWRLRYYRVIEKVETCDNPAPDRAAALKYV